MSNRLARADVVATLMKDIGDGLVICGLGSPVSDVAGTGDRDLNFYLVGAMGCAAGMGLGLALAQPGRAVDNGNIGFGQAHGQWMVLAYRRSRHDGSSRTRGK